MSIPRIILASLPSFCRKLSKLVQIWRSSDKNKFAQCFWDTVYIHVRHVTWSWYSPIIWSHIVIHTEKRSCTPVEHTPQYMERILRVMLYSHSHMICANHKISSFHQMCLASMLQIWLVSAVHGSLLIYHLWLMTLCNWDRSRWFLSVGFFCFKHVMDNVKMTEFH